MATLRDMMDAVQDYMASDGLDIFELYAKRDSMELKMRMTVESKEPAEYIMPTTDGIPWLYLRRRRH